MSIYCRGGGRGEMGGFWGSHIVFSGKEGGVNRRQKNTMMGGGGDYRD